MFKKETVKAAFNGSPYNSGASKAVFEKIVEHNIRDALAAFAKCDMKEIKNYKLLIGLVIGFKYATHAADGTIRIKYADADIAKYIRRLLSGRRTVALSDTEQGKVNSNFKKLFEEYNKLGLKKILEVTELDLKSEGGLKRAIRKRDIRKEQRKRNKITDIGEQWKLIKQQFGGHYTVDDFMHIHAKIKRLKLQADECNVQWILTDFLAGVNDIIRKYTDGISNQTDATNAIDSIETKNQKNLGRGFCSTAPNVRDEIKAYLSKIAEKAKNVIDPTREKQEEEDLD